VRVPGRPRFVLGILFLAVCVTWIAPSLAQWPEAIAFTRLPTGRPEELAGQIWLMNPDGSNQRRLPNIAEPAYVPAISPDRNWIVYVHFDPARPAPRQVWLCRPDGSDQMNVTPRGESRFYHDPMWFPDSRKVLIGFMPKAMADWGLGFEYGYFDVFTGEWTLLEDLTGLEVALSPCGQRLAVVRNGGPSFRSNIIPSHLWVTDLNGRNLGPQTTNRQVFDRGPGWSRDGKKIAFFRQRHVAGSSTQLPTSDLCIMDATVGESSIHIVKEALFRVMSDSSVVWSPDGRKLLVCAGQEGKAGDYSLYTVTLADRKVTRLTDDRFAEEYQDWR